MCTFPTMVRIGTLAAMLAGVLAAAHSAPACAAVVHWVQDCQPSHWMYEIRGYGAPGPVPAGSYGDCGFPANAENPIVVLPSSPSDHDVIRFFDFEPWSVGWEGAPWPRLTVRPESKLVEVTIVGPPPPGPGEGGDAMEAYRMLGLAGSFGPLEPGVWEYRSELEPGVVHRFTVVPEPAALLLPALVCALLARHRRGRRFRARGSVACPFTRGGCR